MSLPTVVFWRFFPNSWRRWGASWTKLVPSWTATCGSNCNSHSFKNIYIPVLLNPSQERLATVGTPAATTLLALYHIDMFYSLTMVLRKSIEVELSCICLSHTYITQATPCFHLRLSGQVQALLESMQKVYDQLAADLSEATVGPETIDVNLGLFGPIHFKYRSN